MAVFTAIAMEYLSRPLFERGQYNEHDARPTAVGVRLNPELGEPAAGYGYNPVHPAHRAGFYGELTVANHIAAAGDKVVRFGNRAGVNGPDIVSVGRNGEVTIWDSKWRTADVPLGPSARPHQSENALQAALKEARESIVVARNAGRLSPEVAERALANLEGNYTIVTVPTGNARGGYVEQVKNQLRVLKDRN